MGGNYLLTTLWTAKMKLTKKNKKYDVLDVVITDSKELFGITYNGQTHTMEDLINTYLSKAEYNFKFNDVAEIVAFLDFLNEARLDFDAAIANGHNNNGAAVCRMLINHFTQYHQEVVEQEDMFDNLEKQGYKIYDFSEGVA